MSDDPLEWKIQTLRRQLLEPDSAVRGAVIRLRRITGSRLSPHSIFFLPEVGREVTYRLCQLHYEQFRVL